MELQRNNGIKTTFSDQHFLLNFIMTTYLGPDIKSDDQKRSAFQRIAQGLPPYTIDDINPSFLSISLLEKVYYYVLRNASPYLILKPNLLHMYVKGILPFQSSALTEDSRQFTSIFPSNLHKQTWFPDSFKNVKGIVLIADPVISYISRDDLAKFRTLSGMVNLKIDTNELQFYQHKFQVGTEGAQTCTKNCKEVHEVKITDGNGNLSAKTFETYKRRHHLYPQQTAVSPSLVPMPICRNEEEDLPCTGKPDGPSIMPLLTAQNMDQCISDASIVLAGTAKKGKIGPPIGIVDIGVSKAAYFFRVALPGVKRDYREFSCEIESNGKVHIRGSTSGGKTIKKRTRVFEMKFQQLCPPGQFTHSFSLPGPVDPRLFSPNFRNIKKSPNPLVQRHRVYPEIDFPFCTTTVDRVELKKQRTLVGEVLFYVIETHTLCL